MFLTVDRLLSGTGLHDAIDNLMAKLDARGASEYQRAAAWLQAATVVAKDLLMVSKCFSHLGATAIHA